MPHHDALRLRFACGADGWRCENLPAAAGPAVRLARFTLAGLAPEAQAAGLAEAGGRLQAGLAPEAGELVRAAWFDLGPERPGRLLLAIHHLAVDGVSWRILLEDLLAAYAGLGRGEAVVPPPRTTSFQFWSRQLEAHARAAATLAELPYWQGVLAGAPALPVDRDPAGAANQMGAASRLVSVLPAMETRQLLAEVPAAYHSRINDVLLTALALALARWRELRGEAAGGGVLVELEGHGRAEALFAGVDLSRTVGWFTSLHPVRLEPGLDAAGVAEALAGGAAAGLALKRVKEQLRAVPGEGIGFGLLRHLNPDAAAGLAGLPRPALLFNYLGQFDRLLPGEAAAAGWALAGDAAGAAVAEARGRGHLLEANAVVAGGLLQVEWRWCQEVHDAASLARAGRAVPGRPARADRALPDPRHGRPHALGLPAGRRRPGDAGGDRAPAPRA